MDLSEKEATWVESIETWNSGGGVMLDQITLKSGQVLIVSDECICRYNSITDFLENGGEYDYDKQCIDLIETESFKIGKPFEFNGINITNPYTSECGRFNVKPGSYYGFAYFKSLEEDNNV